MKMGNFSVTCEWDDEAGVYYVAESNVPGLSAESETVEGIHAILQDRIPELVRLNMPELMAHEAPSRVPFDLYTRRHQDLMLDCA
jgi:hypothetical protein